MFHFARGMNMERDEKENGESFELRSVSKRTHVSDFGSSSSRHRRSKSATDRNSDSHKHEALHCMKINQDSGFNSINLSPKHRLSLENDIKKLQLHLHQEKSTRFMLEKAIGRVSSTLSPGHRHFSAQTRELIAEIELLEEEIAKREQHMLALYRAVFDECVSLPSSAQSSVVTSPAHVKFKKHPTVISSSSFCSSKKFPLQHFQVLASIKEYGRSGINGNNNNMNNTNNNNDGFVKTKATCESSDSIKLPNLGRTLKDHLYQCPNKISEEMVKCLASIYCNKCEAISQKEEKEKLPVLSRSSTSVIFPKRGKIDHLFESKSKPKSNPWSTVSNAFSNYRLLVEQLERVDLNSAQNNAKMAFWINIYNSLFLHAYLVCGAPHNSLRRTSFFHKAAYNIGGQMVTANCVEYFLLSCHTPRVGRWFEILLSTAMRKRCKEEKRLLESKFGCLNSEPLVFFALCTGASSDPMMRVYTAKNVLNELEKAKREFLQTNVVIKNNKKIILPKILERFVKEASFDNQDLLKWVSENGGFELRETIRNCIELNRRKKASQIIEWLPYNTRFMYVFSKDLVEKP
ncbi:hypothetical protein LUZ60_016882 [Juncus effusus]|nr:hypothetical protein LUZ60_016882 [Juncus effusus]